MILLYYAMFWFYDLFAMICYDSVTLWFRYVKLWFCSDSAVLMLWFFYSYVTILSSSDFYLLWIGYKSFMLYYVLFWYKLPYDITILLYVMIL